MERSVLINDDSTETETETTFMNMHLFLIENEQFLNPDMSSYVKSIVKYIAGFIVFQLNKKLHCENCLAAIKSDFDVKTLIFKKSKGYLKYPANSVVTICEITEKCLRIEQSVNGKLGVISKKCQNKIIIEVCKVLFNQILFQNYNDHMKENNHYGMLLKMIINNFLNLRYQYISM